MRLKSKIKCSRGGKKRIFLEKYTEKKKIGGGVNKRDKSQYRKRLC